MTEETKRPGRRPTRVQGADADLPVPEDAPDLSADLAATELAAEDPPEGAELLLPVSAVPRLMRARFFEFVARVDFGALGAIAQAFEDAGGDAFEDVAAEAGVSLGEILLLIEGGAAYGGEALRVVARPGVKGQLQKLIDGEPMPVIMLFLWYMQALRPGEAVPSPTS